MADVKSVFINSVLEAASRKLLFMMTAPLGAEEAREHSVSHCLSKTVTNSMIFD